MLLLSQILAGKNQHGIIPECLLDRGDIVRIERPRQINVADLGYEWELPYRILGGVSWTYNDFAGEIVNLEDRLAKALKYNTHLRVLFCLGYRDLAVPMDSTLLSIDRLHIPDSLRANLTVQYYEGGHMMYLNLPDAEKLRHDIVEFIRGK